MESKYLKLLLDYNLLPQSQRNLSIFEVTGYPHYENVCSNLLAFYLDPNKEHGLGSLLLDSVLILAGQIEQRHSSVKINREYQTISGGRLDLFIVTDSYAIGIENKIFHHLSNDLIDYRNTIDSFAGEQLAAIRIILSLKPIQLENSVGFINIIYGDLWHKVRSRLGFYTLSANQKWMTYLIDFMEATESLTGESMDLTDADRFFIENEQMIEKLVKDHESFISRLNFQVKTLKDLMDSLGDAPKSLVKRWIYLSSYLVHDYLLSGHKVAFDLQVSPKGWILKLFDRSDRSNKYILELISSRRSQLSIDENKILIASWPLETGLDDIKEKLYEWMEWVVKEDESRGKSNI